jgi:predicted porin
MKKSLIAVAVAGMFAAPVAMAEVTLSGAINLGIEVGKSSGGASGSSVTQTSLANNYSHVDLESVDDIGNGNKIIFHYQLIAAPQAATGLNNVNRNSFLGIAGGWGAFKMGTNENVYERMMYTADPLDGALGPGGNLMLLGTPGGAAFQQGQCGSGVTGTNGASVGGPGTAGNLCGPTNGQVDFYRRTDHTIWYESPDFSGFTFEIDYTLSAFKTAGPGSIDPKVLSVGGKFQPANGPFYIDLSYEKHDDMFGANAIAAGRGIAGAGVGTGSNDRGIQVGAGYAFGDLGLHVRYEQLKYKTDGAALGALSEYKRNAYWLGVKFALPSGYIGGELGIAQDGKANGTKIADTGAKLFGIGYFHNLSKQSQLQFIYGRTDNDDAANYVQAGTPGGGLGATNQVFHVGIKHTY